MLAYLSYDPLVYIGLGPLRLSPHGLGIAIGFLVGARVMLPAAEKRGITADDVSALLVRAAIGAIVGARLAYVLNHLGDYTANPLEIVQIWKGGISLLGGFFGAIAWALPDMRKRRLSFWQVMDAAAPGMAVGVIIGRIGDLVVADHLGKTTSFVLGYRCPPSSVDTAVPCIAGPGGAVHQPALYDFVLTIVVLAVLLWLRRKPRYDGFLIIAFGFFYGLNRFIEDWFRIDDTHGTGLTGSQWTAVITMLLCGWWLVLRRRTPGWGQWNDSAIDTPSMHTESGAEE
ncbi:MAG TPA: prolipoprotein diacylglyceryl transferase [Acidimicrobiales bacterium]|nr:prolipoprotein diacylglyceryl transferase [Acidimicrobiales bacterium]